MKNITQGHFCFDKSKQVNQKGSATLMVIVIILVIVAIGTYFYTQKNKAPSVSEGEPVSAVQFEDGFTASVE